jgi:Na+/melibiose symporter-like transporter
VVGPGLAGVLIGIVRAPFAVVLDALSFLGSGLFILWIRRPEPPPDVDVADGAPRPGFRSEMAEGLRWVLGNPYLRSIAACTGSSNLFSSITFAVLLVFAVRLMGMTAEGIGLAFSIGSLGALLGAVSANRISARLGVGRTIVLFAAIGGPPEIIFALAPVGTAQPILVGLVALVGFLGGLGSVVYNVAQVSFRQAITPTRLQGRMNATMRWIVWGTMPASSAASWGRSSGSARRSCSAGSAGRSCSSPSCSARSGGSGRCRIRCRRPAGITRTR